MIHQKEHGKEQCWQPHCSVLVVLCGLIGIPPKIVSFRNLQFTQRGLLHLGISCNRQRWSVGKLFYTQR